MSADRRKSEASIVVYTRPLCIWCWKVKRLLRSRGLSFEERSAASPKARAWLQSRTGSPTVPQVFAGDELIGGYEETVTWVG